MKNYYTYLKYLLVISTIFFAIFNFYNKIVNPYSANILKCEGIVLDTTLNYHITNKNTHKSLRKIRGGFIDIQHNDLLLHYRDKDMEKTTPSFWGSIFFNQTSSEWNFKLDKSFTENPWNKNNIHLPFFRKLSDHTFFYKGGTVLTEKNLKEKHFINNIGGSKSSRFYLQLKKINNIKILPFYDDGIKRKYSLRSTDTILVSFNKKVNNIHQYFYSFKFDNSTNFKINYELIFSNNSLKLKNLSTNSLIDIKDDFFVIGNMMFSLSPRYSFWEILLLLSFLLIVIGSIIYLLLKKTPNNSIDLFVNNLRISILFFYLLGFPILITAFDVQHFSCIRKIILTTLVPFIPISTIVVFRKKNKILSKLVSSFNVLFTKLVNNKIGITILLFFGISFLFTAKNERIMGVIPTLHYVKLILFIIFYLLYTHVFASFFNLIKGKFDKKYRTYIKSLIIICVAFITSIITKDFGSLILIFFTCLFFEYSFNNIPIKLRKMKIGLLSIISMYIIVSFLTFLLGYFFQLPDKAYRLTYTWANPDSFFYNSISSGDRESLGIVFQNLKLIEKFPLGVKNLIIPAESISVSHTDYAIIWSVVNNGLVFLCILLASLLFFIKNSFQLVFLLVNKKNDFSIINAPVQMKAFISFILIFLVLQCIVPLMSNLMLPSAFLTGIPFPGISISIGDSLFLFLLFFLLDKIINQHKTIPEKEFIAFGNASITFSNRISYCIMSFILTLIIIKGFMVYIQSPVTEFKSENKFVEGISDIPKNRIKLLKYTADYFNDVNEITNLKEDKKLIVNMVCCTYFTNNTRKLSPLKTNFNINFNKLSHRIIADSLLNFKKEVLVRNKKEVVFFVKHFVNGKEKLSVSSPYYRNLDFNNKNLDIDLSATLNKEIETFLLKKLKKYYNKLNVSFLITDNISGDIFVNAAYPIDNNHLDVQFNYFPGSVKKIILAHYFSHNNESIYNSIFKSRKAPNAKKWISKSDNNATIEYWKKIDLESFKIFLKRYYPDFPYRSNSLVNGYNIDNDKAYNNSVIGGKIKYTPQQINNWMQNCSKEAFSANQNLFELLNSPFYGTANKVGIALKDNGYDTNRFICKTGTLEFNNSNISTTFIIANKRYTISILIDGIQPDNIKGSSAKHLFIHLIPFLKDYLNPQ